MRTRLYACVIVLAAVPCLARQLWVPVLQSPWWRISEKSPDVAPYNNYPTHEAVDFTIFKTATGSWRLVACVRYTTLPGGTRLFHAWETSHLTNTMWTPAQIVNTFITNGVAVTVTNGIFAVSNTNAPFFQAFGSLQAPHCFKHNGRYYLFYNSNGAFCKTSDDGLVFVDATNYAGAYKFFDMGRDVMLFSPTNDLWVAYYTSAAIMQRTASKLEGPWSAASVVRSEGNPESPFVVAFSNTYYLWQQMKVAESPDYLNFNRAYVAHLTKLWYSGYYAPEIIYDDEIDQYYVAGYNNGIWMARMGWELQEVDDADLLVLETSGVTFTPAFHRTTTWYTASAAFTLASTTQTYVEADALASIMINGAPSLGSRIHSVLLGAGANLVELSVTAQNGSRKVYTIYISRASNPGLPHLQASAGLVTVMEGGTNTVGVRLSAAPSGTATVSVARVYGDTDISILGPTNFIFTPANFNVFQFITVAAQLDIDRDNGTALLHATCPGYERIGIAIRESDQRAGILVPVDVDFGPLASTGRWNNIFSHTAGTSRSNLTARTGDPTSLSLHIAGGFADSSTNGVVAGVFPPSAQQDGFIVPAGMTGTIIVAGLNDAHTYDLTLFGSDILEQDDYRVRTRAGAAAGVLDTANNIMQTLTLERLAPSADGTLAVGLERVGTAPDDRAVLNAFVLRQRPAGGTVLFDFGPTLTPGNWNNVTSTNEGTGVINAIDMFGEATGIDLVITDAFHQSTAIEGLDTNTLYPATAQLDCLRTFNTGDPVGAFQLRGLNPLAQYELAFYAAAWRSGARGTDYTVQGVTRTLSATSNFYNLCVFSNVTPTSAGVINVSMRAMAGASWGYVNVMELRPSGSTAARTFAFDCGVPELTTPGAWNNLTNAETGLVLTQLVDTNGGVATVLVAISNPFESVALCGVNASNVFPASAQQDGFVLGHTHSNAWLMFYGLASNTTYDITVFGSHALTLPNRGTWYHAGGHAAWLDTRNNANRLAWLPSLTSQAGQITLHISSSGTNAGDFACLNVMTIDMIVPEPAAWLVLVVMLGATRRRPSILR